ncbi:tetratricopeptide repeat protein [Variovorax sp. LT1R16]|uniref:tetratricopeptide repeat protein n=1 Tax=Variovorax sp. LT1R16 TaxID=3443728 RepID=UPI003F4971C8
MESVICVPFAPGDFGVLIEADSGMASAQRDLGQIFASHDKPEIAVYWFSLAAEQGDADAMQCLGTAHAAGQGVPKDDDLALMWIAKAAAHGHMIAKAQTRSLRL